MGMQVQGMGYNDPYYYQTRVNTPYYGNGGQVQPIFVGQQQQVKPKKEKKMGFFEGIGKAFVGMGKSVLGVLDSLNPTSPNFNLGAAFKMVACAAVAIAFPPAGVAMAVVGGISGAAKMGKGIYDACTAETYEEQVAAAESAGAGALQVGLSVLGAKAGLKAMQNTAGSSMANLSKFTSKGKLIGFKEGVKLGDKLTAFGKDAITGGRGTMLNGVKGFGNIMKTSGKAWTTAGKGQGYALTRGVTKLHNNIGESGLIKGVGKTVTETRTEMHNSKLAKKANKQGKKLDKVQEQYDAARKEINDINRQMKELQAQGKKIPNELNKKFYEANDRLSDASSKLAAQDKPLNEAKAAQSEAERLLKKAQRDAEYNKYNKGYEVTDEALEALEKSLERAGKKVGNIENFNEQVIKAQARYATHQKDIAKAEQKVKDLEKEFEGKKLTTGEERRLAEAKASVRQLKSHPPVTNLLGQFGQAAEAAGYTRLGVLATTAAYNPPNTNQGAVYSQQAPANYVPGPISIDTGMRNPFYYH